MKSKRNDLRFVSKHQVVSYKTAYDAGEAQLINISAGGCALDELSLPLVLHEKILVSIRLSGEDDVFQAQGKVVRVEGGGVTALKFTLVEPEDQARMRKHFSRLRAKILKK